MKFNINSIVKIQLTQYGRDILRKQHDELVQQFHDFGVAVPQKLLQYNPPVEDEDGWSHWQLVDVMHLFGPYLHAGNPQVPFVMTIEVPTPYADY